MQNRHSLEADVSLSLPRAASGSRTSKVSADSLSKEA